ncbi:MAG: transporter substrate-binding domain-containing protein [Casimicrobiaceae bacterium]
MSAKDLSMSPSLLEQLAPTGVLRAGINMGNFLLVTGRSQAGEPEGVSPDMARAIAVKLGVEVRFVPFATPGELADAAGNDVWDVGLIGAEPQRAAKIDFSPAYVEIQSTYMVPPASTLQTVADVDRNGVRIASTARAAYDLWLERNIRNATVVRTASLDAAFEAFATDGLEALAGLRPRLVVDQAKMPGARILPGQFMAVQQAIGTTRGNADAAGFIRIFVEQAKASGFVAGLIKRHKVNGLSVAPAA